METSVGGDWEVESMLQTPTGGGKGFIAVKLCTEMLDESM